MNTTTYTYFDYVTKTTKPITLEELKQILLDQGQAPQAANYLVNKLRTRGLIDIPGVFSVYWTKE